MQAGLSLGVSKWRLTIEYMKGGHYTDARDAYKLHKIA